MSTGLECMIYESLPNQWYYTLQDGSCPVQCWDWTEYSTTYGPFGSEEDTHTHLHDNHANPGGYGLTPYRGDGVTPLNAELVAKAEKPVSRERFPFGRRNFSRLPRY